MMGIQRRIALWMSILVIAPVLAACGGGGDAVVEVEPTLPPPPPVVTMLVHPKVEVDEGEVGVLAQRLFERTGLSIDIQLVDSGAEALAGFCGAQSELPVIAWLDRASFAISQIDNCGVPQLKVIRDAETAMQFIQLDAPELNLLTSAEIASTAEAIAAEATATAEAQATAEAEATATGDEAPADEADTDEADTDDSTTDETPADETPDDESADDTTADETATEDVTDESATDESTSDDSTTDETTSDETTDETASDEVPADETADDETTATLTGEPDAGEAGLLLVSPSAGTSNVSVVTGNTYCRLGLNDFYSWILPDIMVSRAQVDIRSAAQITDYPDVESLVEAVATGECVMTGVSAKAFALLDADLQAQVTVVETSAVMPYDVLVYPLDVQLGVRLAINDVLVEFAENPATAELLFPLLGQTAIEPVVFGEFSATVDYIANSGYDFSELGD